MLIGYPRQTIPENLAKKNITNRETNWVTTTPTVVWINEELEQLSPHDKIEVFEFRSLRALGQSFLDSGDYTPKEVAELIQGLSRLPGYAAKTTNQSRGASPSRK